MNGEKRSHQGSRTSHEGETKQVETPGHHGGEDPPPVAGAAPKTKRGAAGVYCSQRDNERENRGGSWDWMVRDEKYCVSSGQALGSSDEDIGIRKWPCILDRKLPMVKRPRTTSNWGCSKPKWTQVESESESSSNIMSHKVRVPEDSGRSLSLNAKRLAGRTYDEKGNNSQNNLEKQLAGNSKRFDDNEECSSPLFTETSDEEDNIGTSDSDAYSGPSGSQLF